MVAIIPAAGKGTRMADITHGRPKELLRLGRKTVLELVIEEARQADPDRIVVVSAENKPELSDAARALGVEVVLQTQPLGLADAVACVGVEDEALILFGDCVFEETGPSARLAELVRKGIDGAIAVEAVTDEETRLYGIVEANEFSGGISGILEKPGPERTTSRWAVAARMAFGYGFMTYLLERVAMMTITPAKEVSLTPILRGAIDRGFDFKAVPLLPDQKRIDCGSPEEYLAAVRR
jgi:UTP--glucose-1-phosphate uridylyltransferase